MIYYLINLYDQTLVGSFEGTLDEVPEGAKLAAERATNETGATHAIARMELSFQHDGPPRELDSGDSGDSGEPVDSGETEQWLEEWFREKCSALSKEERDAFRAGVGWALDRLAEADRKAERKADRKADAAREVSSLCGREIVLFRPLWPHEIERENKNLSKIEGLTWPAIQLDDGTLVYPAKTVEGQTVPAKFFGYVPSAPEGKRKQHFSVSFAALEPSAPKGDPS